MIADIDKTKIRNVVRKTCTERRKISLLKELKIELKRFLGKSNQISLRCCAKFVGTFKRHVMRCVERREGRKV